jgi:hypothetical protein
MVFHFHDKFIPTVFYFIFVALVDGIAFVVSFSAILLVVYENATDFIC